MRKTVSILAAVISLTAIPAMALDADGVSLNPEQLPWARWQGRLSLSSGTVATKAGNASLMGDYYFGRSLAGPGGSGGFRATSGLIFGPRITLSTGQPGPAAGNAFSIGTRLFGPHTRPTPNDAADNVTLPYLGFGYTGLSAGNGWSFSADLGLVAQTPGGLKLARGQTLDDAVREMRLAPLVQFAVSYAF